MVIVGKARMWVIGLSLCTYVSGAGITKYRNLPKYRDCQRHMHTVMDVYIYPCNSYWQCGLVHGHVGRIDTQHSGLFISDSCDFSTETTCRFNVSLFFIGNGVTLFITLHHGEQWCLQKKKKKECRFLIYLIRIRIGYWRNAETTIIHQDLWLGKLVLCCHQRSELSNSILCIFSIW